MAAPRKLSWLDETWKSEVTDALVEAGTGQLDNVTSTRATDRAVSRLDSEDASAIRFTGVAPTVTGIAGGWPGRRLHLLADGGDLTLADANDDSDVANRLTCGSSDATIVQGTGAWLVYDNGRWRLSGGGGGGSGAIPGSDGQALFNDSSAMGATPLLTVAGANVNVGDGSGSATISAADVTIEATDTSVIVTADNNIYLTANTGGVTIEADGASGDVALVAARYVGIEPAIATSYRAVGPSGNTLRYQYTAKLRTTDASAHVLAHLAAVDAIIGKTTLTVICEINVTYDGGADGAGGNLTIKAAFKGNSGTSWTKIAQVDQSEATLWDGAPVGGVDINVVSGNNIVVNVTGISATDVTWAAKIDAIAGSTS